MKSFLRFRFRLFIGSIILYVGRFLLVHHPDRFELFVKKVATEDVDEELKSMGFDPQKYAFKGILIEEKIAEIKSVFGFKGQ